MSSISARWFLCCLFLLTLVGCGDQSATKTGKKKMIAPVSVAAVRVEPIEMRRVFSGSLASPRRFELAAKTGGRVLELLADLGTALENGQLVLTLENEAPRQAVNLSAAEMAVAEAEYAQAKQRLPLQQRELERQTALYKQGVATDAQVDDARNAVINGESALAVAKSRVERAKAALAVEQLTLDETELRAAWRQGVRRVVAERLVQEGDLVRPNQVLFRLVELNPIIAEVSVPERDYGRIRVGQSVVLHCDAFPGETFSGRVARIAPVFDPLSRQARVELDIENPNELLKPGMFVRAEIVVARAERVVTVPIEALVDRFGETGVFLVNDAGDRVAWHPVQTGIRSETRVAVSGEGLAGRVVTLGQQLIGDGSAVVIPNAGAAEAAEAAAEAGTP
ncbi:efflux RND transporter periplasmic adaptor subunit [Acanthopleuribacter pedis]|uniref:Efflux RND transporter periplasmic adaptor subunit n=1 Tax=Acanthopleuribacter pedis TaxID=442870 RepID=A0A8J7QAU8_9BACT|nr:efflux RND transporter periplasmic adaptor subunit [Acanthopleuribacter pedis]MBO1317411.1 efflux RND transporter periplasmic adaptor subunit [Acanthopleuribacter pedis]